MLEEVTYPIGSLVFIDRSGFDEDLDSRRVAIVHRCEDRSQAVEVFGEVVHYQKL
mgnify:CR=1